MRLRSNHVLEPVSEWQPPRRRRGTRGTSAQPEQEATSQPANEAQAPKTTRPARKGPAKKGRKAKKDRKAQEQMSVVPEEAPACPPATSPLSPVPSPLTTPFGFWPSPTPVGLKEPPTLPPVPVARRRVVPAIPLSFPSAIARAVPRIVENSPFLSSVRKTVADMFLPSSLPSNEENQDPEDAPIPPQSPAPSPYIPRRSITRNRLWNHRAFQWGSATELLPPPRQLEYLPNGLVVTPSPLTSQDLSRKRSRTTEDESPVKRYRSTQPAIRPRGSSRTTYADRQRRRQAERSGRIDRTMFRIPQRLAQQNADASSIQPPQETSINEETPTAEENTVPLRTSLPSALPEPSNQTGWGRWVFAGVTRPLTNLLSRRTSLPQVTDVSPLTERDEQQSNIQAGTPRRSGSENQHFVNVPSSAPPKSSSAVLPSRASLTPASGVAASTEASQRSASLQPTSIIPKNYDLFSRGFDPAQLARWFSNPVPSTENSNLPQSPSPQSPTQQAQPSSVPESTKRKRSVSPDVIPNPPGCSYGLNDDYFIYDDEDWAAQERDNPDDTPTKSATKISPRQKRSSKKARIERPENFNHQGHFETPGWSSSEISSSPQTTPLGPHATGSFSRQATVETVEDDHSATPNGNGLRATIESVENGPRVAGHKIGKKNGLAGLNDRHLLKKARDQAEQYKPKTPSRLRSAHRFSAGSDSGASDFQLQLSYQAEDALRRRRMRKTSLAKACPSGDLREIIWPEFEPWTSRLSCFIHDEVVEWVRTMPHRQDWRVMQERQAEFNGRFLEEINKKRADPNYVPRMWN